MKKVLLFLFLTMQVTAGLNAQVATLIGKKVAKAPCTTMLGDIMFSPLDTTKGRNVADNYKSWENGDVIRVKFLYGIGSQALRQRIIQYVKEWELYANIKFDFVSDTATKTNVRVLLGSMYDSLGHNSAVGTDCNYKSQFMQTMNLDTSDFIDYDYYFNDIKTGGSFYKYLINIGRDMKKYSYEQFYKDVVYAPLPKKYIEKYLRGTPQHEFGHALGLMHEQSYPGAIKWNKDTVYKYYAGQNWDKQRVDHNVFRVSEQFFTNSTSYDPKSIMHYAVYSWQTTDGYSVEETNQISEGDKKLISALYPKNKKISDLAVPKVVISNFTRLSVISDKVRKALIIKPTFSLKSGAKLANAFFVAYLTTEDGKFYIPTTSLLYNWNGSASVNRKILLLPNSNVTYNSGSKTTLELVFPFNQIPDLKGKKFGVEFCVFQDDVASGKLNRLVTYAYSSPMEIAW